MAIARDPRTTWKYVLREDRELPRDKQTVFHLKHLTLAQEQAAFDGIERTHGQSVIVNTGARCLDILRAGLTGWDNLLDESGATIEPKKDAQGRVRDESLMLLSLEQRLELAGAIEHEVVYDPDTVGKSAPSST